MRRGKKHRTRKVKHKKPTTTWMDLKIRLSGAKLETDGKGRKKFKPKKRITYSFFPLGEKEHFTKKK